jgi:hypothetical protein
MNRFETYRDSIFHAPFYDIGTENKDLQEGKF